MNYSFIHVLGTSHRGMAFGASALAMAFSLSALPTIAYAQSGDSAETASDTDIIVTARRREEKIQDVPVVISAIKGDSIEKLNLRDAKELVALVPGLDLRSNGYAASIQLRGLQFDINSGASASVATYLNDAPIQTRALLTQLYDMGQIEVLHGPQGTLKGQATPSGSITFTTRKPDLEKWGGYVSGTVTNAHGYNVNGAINIPLVKDVLGVRLAGVWDKNRSNRVHSISPNAQTDEPFNEEKGGRVSVMFKPADWLRVEGTYQHIDHEDSRFNQYASYSLVDPTGAASPSIIRPQDRLSIEDTQTTQHQKYDIFNWRGELRFAGQKLIYQGSKVNFNSLGKSNQDSANFLPKVDVYQTTSLRAPTSSHELRLQNENRVAGMFDYVVGYYHTSGPSFIHLDVQTPILLPSFLGGGIASIVTTPIDTVSAGGNPPLPTTETSFFGNVIAHIGDKFQLSGGLRHIKIVQPESFIQIGSNAVSNGAAVNDQKWIYTASAQYKITPDVMVYFSTGSSHRIGPSIFNQALLQSPLERSFRQLKAEDSHSYELGIRSEWLDKRLVFNITGFHQTFTNYSYKLSNNIYYVDYDFINGGFVPKVGNSSQWGAGVPVTINGVDFELGWTVSTQFSFNLVASYADAKIKNGTIPCNDLNGDHIADMLSAAPTVAQLQAAYGANQIGSCSASLRASQQSPFSATLQAEYNVPVGNKMEAFARGLLSFYGASQNDPTLAFDNIGSYGLLNLFAGLRAQDRTWELTFFGKNVFNTVKYSQFGTPASTSYQELAPPTFRTTVGKAFTSTYSQITTTPPREFGVNLRIAIGSR